MFQLKAVFHFQYNPIFPLFHRISIDQAIYSHIEVFEKSTIV